MLILKEKGEDSTTHNFILNKVVASDVNTFELTSTTLALTLPFTLEAPISDIPPGYSVTVHLFKNTFHKQQDIIDLRVDGLTKHNGKIGYFFRLDALFEKNFLQINEHIYPYAYLGLKYIFSQLTTLQTKDVEVSPDYYEISHFFDDRTIILVLCNEYCANIPDFNIDNYLAQLFLYGFVSLTKDNPITSINDVTFIENKYNSLKPNSPGSAVHVLRIPKANSFASDEAYITHLFKNLVQQQVDPITRFIMMYQVIEIFISKLFHYEIQNHVCANLNTLDSHKLKDLMRDLQTQKTIINSLFSKYSRPSNALETEIKAKLLDFFIHITDPDYNDPLKHNNFTLTDLFYDYRNKLVHKYRLIHSPGLNQANITSKIHTINQLSEALMAEVISNLKLNPLGC